MSNAFAAVGTLLGGAAEGNAADYNAAVNQQNATMTRQQGSAAVEKQRRENVRLLGSIKANYGASGITMEGSAMDVFAASAAEAELDAQNTAYNYEVKARGYDAESTLNRARANNARTGAFFSAGAQLMNPMGNSQPTSAGTDPRAGVRGQQGY